MTTRDPLVEALARAEEDGLRRRVIGRRQSDGRPDVWVGQTDAFRTALAAVPVSIRTDIRVLQVDRPDLTLVRRGRLVEPRVGLGDAVEPDLAGPIVERAHADG